ncbi:hypothetical protein, conserved [Babesia ovata]|uniref:C3H1-type domain-containing protein n=1 Tax=Babesia ovata TaxID=189622 RepID=A0A2H6KJD3_9APIC|nr:uncharacterized protein BOVATA_045890 [Babesia ovata]GBE63096.1 hypothetical protein, conserved [Babesia ovata]
MVSLAELSGKLGQFIGKSDAVTKAIENGIDSIINSDDDFKSLRNPPSSTGQSPAPVPAVSIDTNMLDEKIQHYEKEIELLESNKNSQNPPLSAEESRLLSSYESKLDALQKLKSLNESFKSLSTTQSDNCKNLLNNLCTGLEKFLGYQETSKGYDGTGIVYSDLDRLCDGVVAFLHGVLESVKNDESVTTYDKNNVPNIDKVISDLHDNVGKGRKAFQAAVTEVEGKMKSVTGPIEDIKTLIKQHKEDSSTPKKSIAEQVAEWTRRAGEYIEKAKKADEALAEIDPKLKDKLKCPIDMLLQATRTFEENAKNRDIVEVIDMASKQFSDVLPNLVNTYAVQATAAVAAAKEKRVNEINQYIREVEQEVSNVHRSLARWINDANSIVHHCITATGEVHSKLQAKNTATTIGKAFQNIEEAKQEFDNVNKKLQEFDSKLKEGLRKAKSDIINGINIYVKELKKKISVDSIKSGIQIEDRDISENSVLKDTELSKRLEAATHDQNAFKDISALTAATTVEKLKDVLEAMKTRLNGTDGYAGTLIGGIGDDMKDKVDKALPYGIGQTADLNKIGNYAESRNQFGDAINVSLDEMPTLNKLMKDKIEVIENALMAIMIALDSLTPLLHNNYDGTLDRLLKLIDEEIGKKLNAILGSVKQLNDTYLFNLRMKVEKILREAEEATYKEINRIRGFMLEDLSGALTTIKNAALRKFAATKQNELEDLKKLVTDQSARIEDLISLDSMIGLKGLLREMKAWLEDRSLIHIQSPVEFTGTASQLKQFLDAILDYIRLQVRTPAKAPGQEPEPNEESIKVGSVRLSMDDLLKYLHHGEPHPDDPTGKRIYIFDHHSDKLLSSLSSSISALSPSNFHGFHNPLLLDALRRGMTQFTEQLSCAYVNAYSGSTFNGNLLDDKHIDDPDQPQKQKTIKVLSTEGRNCAKVCSTILETMKVDFDEFHEHCGGRITGWKDQKVCLINAKKGKNDLGGFLKRCGYGVPSEEGVQDAELGCYDNVTGQKIVEKLAATSTDKSFSRTFVDTLETLMTYLKTYYQVCHLPTPSSTKYPSSVYQMLIWLSGLPNNSVYQDLSFNGFDDLFDKPEKTDTEEIEDGGITVEPNSKPLQTYKETVTVGTLSNALTAVCAQSHSVLTAILGHGHAGGRYAVDFNTNEDEFSYPSNMNSLICVLFDIVKRLHDQLYFLYRQCMHDSKLSGWSDCWYGHNIGGTAWKCNTLQCPNQSGDQIANQTHKQTCNQKCDQRVSCGVKSPLQSFLEDGLQGFLPHSLKSERGKLECSVKPHFNLPCKTPMGFSDISHMASHRQTGRHIREALFDVCSGEWSAFSRLCSLLNCLLPSAPKTLDDMFGFYNTFLNGWNKTVERELKYTVNGANFERTDATLDIRPLFKSGDHGSDQNMPHLKGDLYSLVNCKYNGKSSAAFPCGPYLRPLCYYRCDLFAAKNNDKYVSWIVYLTESFLELLEKLYEECCKNCDSATSKCRISKCSTDCEAKDAKMSVASTHNASCNSIVHCNLMRPTFFKHGFVYRDCKSLADQTTKRTCKDLCKALENVIDKKEKSKHVLAEFVYRTIPDYLCKIRWPFMLTLLTLWSLSLLYLLHIAVVRLDVLRIRSHLRSPASHRIAAQSLLAAARVKALANVKYFSP